MTSPITEGISTTGALVSVLNVTVTCCKHLVEGCVVLVKTGMAETILGACVCVCVCVHVCECMHVSKLEIKVR